LRLHPHAHIYVREEISKIVGRPLAHSFGDQLSRLLDRGIFRPFFIKHAK
jgi:hypothetical protein